MRQFPIALCIAIAGCGFATSAGAVNPPLTFTLDLLAPCSVGPCTGSHPTDVNLQLQADDFIYAQDTSIAGSPFVATLTVKAPMVCDEIAAGGVSGASSPQRLAPKFTNQATGGLLEFNAGGPTIVDLGSVMYDGTIPAGVAATYSNQAAPQVTCYQINPVTGGPPVLAVGPNGIFVDRFEDRHAHFGDEPWISVLTVASPASVGPQSVGSGSPQHTNFATLPGSLVYIVQIHHAQNATDWRVNFGYDQAFFNVLGSVPQWCVLSSAQPGVPTTCSSGGLVSTAPVYTVNSGDIQDDSTDSIYLQVTMTGSSAAISNWHSLSGTMYAATASVFPEFGTYPERFDDKSAVVSSNNMPVQNVSSIVCNNDTTSTTCTITDQDGHTITGGVQGQLTTTSSITAGGAVTVDPLAYFVDPNSGDTLPGTDSSDAMSVSNVSCSDPNGILATPISASNFSAINGSEKLDFSFAGNGGLYVPGTATCTATFNTPAAFSPSLGSTQSFTITMAQVLLASVTVTPPTGAVAPASVQTFDVVVANAGNGPLSDVSVSDPGDSNFTITGWTCNGTSCPSPSGNGALAQGGISLPVGASLTYAVTGTVAASPSPANLVSNSATISGPGLSCAGGNCTTSASVVTVPIIAIAMNETPSSYVNNGDPVSYTITLTNSGGTDFSAATLTDPGVAGLSFGSWTCVAAGLASACPNAGGTSAIAESNIGIGSGGGTVTYTLPATVTVPVGNITNLATVGISGNAICANGICVASQLLTGP